MTTTLGGCTCSGKAPTVPVYRDRMTHLDDCPAKGSDLPVGALAASPAQEATPPREDWACIHCGKRYEAGDVPWICPHCRHGEFCPTGR